MKADIPRDIHVLLIYTFCRPRDEPCYLADSVLTPKSYKLLFTWLTSSWEDKKGRALWQPQRRKEHSSHVTYDDIS